MVDGTNVRVNDDAMSLLDDAIKLQVSPGSACQVQRLKADNPELHDELLAALDSAIHASAIVRALEVRGVKLTPESLTRHRRRECQRCR